MKKIFSITICLFTILCFVSCGNEEVVEEPPTEDIVVEVAPLSEDDFIITSESENGTEEKNLLSELDEYGDDEVGALFYYYDPNYDDSKEGVIKTNRNVVLGNSKDSVVELYGEGKSGDFDKDNDYCYELAKQMIVDDISDSPDYSAVMSAQCVSFVRYTYNDKYTISFYFDEDDQVSWIFFTKKA